jgi:hypothetical protein
MNNFLIFIEKDIVRFYDSLLASLYNIDKKQENNNIKARCQRISRLLKQLKDANYQLFNELKTLHQEKQHQDYENQRKTNAKLFK